MVSRLAVSSPPTFPRVPDTLSLYLRPALTNAQKRKSNNNNRSEGESRFSENRAIADRNRILLDWHGKPFTAEAIIGPQRRLGVGCGMQLGRNRNEECDTRKCRTRDGKRKGKEGNKVNKVNKDKKSQGTGQPWIPSSQTKDFPSSGSRA